MWQSKKISARLIQRAARFWVLIKESFGANLHSFGLRSRDMEKAKEYLGEVSKRLNKVVIENQDFQQILKNYDKRMRCFILIRRTMKLRSIILTVSCRKIILGLETLWQTLKVSLFYRIMIVNISENYIRIMSSLK